MPAVVRVSAVELSRQVARLEIDVEVGLDVAFAAGDRAVDDEEVEPAVAAAARAPSTTSVFLGEEGCQPLDVRSEPSLPGLGVGPVARLVHGAILAGQATGRLSF